MLLNWRTFFLKNSAAYMIIVIRDLLGRLYLLGRLFFYGKFQHFIKIHQPLIDIFFSESY